MSGARDLCLTLAVGCSQIKPLDTDLFSFANEKGSPAPMSTQGAVRLTLCLFCFFSVRLRSKRLGGNVGEPEHLPHLSRICAPSLLRLVPPGPLHFRPALPVTQPSFLATVTMADSGGGGVGADCIVGRWELH